MYSGCSWVCISLYGVMCLVIMPWVCVACYCVVV